ncbi:MAG: P-loop NTPase fold protein, partial [Candidatus Marithrix sp.]
MSLEKIEEVIEDFLKTDIPEVIAIKGKWGTGKTYFWNDILKQAAENDNETTCLCCWNKILKKVFKNDKKISLNKYSYVSLFGINSLESLKLTIFEQIIDKQLIKNGVSLETFKSNVDGFSKSIFRKILNKLPTLISDLFPSKNWGSFVQSMSFLSVSKTLICFDDFERKGDSLSAKDILGLVSILKESKKCKIVLIFNEDTFNKDSKKDYQDFREKVIDIELSFIHTSSDCSKILFKE